MLCVNNLSRFPSRSSWTCAGSRASPRGVLGGVTFPPIGELRYLLTLPGYGFYWFQLPPVQHHR